MSQVDAMTSSPGTGTARAAQASRAVCSGRSCRDPYCNLREHLIISSRPGGSARVREATEL
jgi:hypothetical protein